MDLGLGKKYNKHPKLLSILALPEPNPGSKILPELGRYLKCRAWREKPPAGSYKRSNGLKMSLSYSPPFWACIPLANKGVQQISI